QGLPQDTICQWIVPDTQSNMGNKLWLVVKGQGRYDSTSSPFFYIRRGTRTKETSVSQSEMSFPNPQSEINLEVASS
ncbi:MAG: hypothetical protein ABIL40_07480, partial [candidate division WOR-3 bacterium]